MKRVMIGAMLAVLAAGSGGAQAPKEDPLTRPIAPGYADRWLKPQPPMRVYGNTYLVGFTELNVALIRTKAGLILIDTGVPQGVAMVEANIRRLGFDVRQVKYILSTEPHYDHGGGFAAMVRDSGATVIAGQDGATSLRLGRALPEDPQAAHLDAFPAVPKVRAVADGGTIRLGDVVVTARATPGHTSGSMSWTWKSCEGGKCIDMVFASSLNPVSAEGYRFTDPAHAGIVASYRRSFATMAALPCGVLITAHPDQSGGDEKFAKLSAGAKPNPFLDPDACRAYAAKFSAALDARLAKEGVR
ncbi:subclass B3 metallo-beta-lactamase [Sphingomonas sp.]|uniref:subclass B3 metallo-beta-lactamase n=1 Tax=Sphingomonas sp. TaxID=28214 RepID=UPI003D6CC99A